MYLVVIAWLYVTVMMAVVEALSPNGTVLGAFITLVLYGLLPLSILIYIMGTPGRKRKIHAQQLAEQQAWQASKALEAAAAPANSASVAPDAGSEAAAAAQDTGVAPVGEKP